VVFVVDGTWISARKTMQRSANLRPLPRLSFDPPHPSRFRLRKQPEAHCLSTVEAIHHTIELLGSAFDFPVESRTHDSLLHAFSRMEERQIELARPQQPRFLERRAKA
jgi:DTW domain-containing protein YfiP